MRRRKVSTDARIHVERAHYQTEGRSLSHRRIKSVLRIKALTQVLYKKIIAAAGQRKWRPSAHLDSSIAAHGSEEKWRPASFDKTRALMRSLEFKFCKHQYSANEPTLVPYLSLSQILGTHSHTMCSAAQARWIHYVGLCGGDVKSGAARVKIYY